MSRLPTLAAGLRKAAWPLRARLGDAGVAGLLLLLAAALLALWQYTRLPSMEAERGALLREARALAEEAKRPPRERPRGPEQALAALPAPTGHAADLRVLYRVAQRHHVEIERADLQQTSAADAEVVVVGATLPLRGRYVDLKRCAGEWLQTLPHAALLDLRLERPDIGSRELKARVRLALHYRRGEP